MNKIDKKWWRKETKSYKFSPKNIRNIQSNENLLKNATKWRIVSIGVKNTYKYYIIEGFINGEWKFLKGTEVMYSTPYNHWYRNCENAYNRCKKLARKFPEIKINDLIKYSGMASMVYGSIPGGYKNNIDLKELY